VPGGVSSKKQKLSDHSPVNVSRLSKEDGPTLPGIIRSDKDKSSKESLQYNKGVPGTIIEDGHPPVNINMRISSKIAGEAMQHRGMLIESGDYSIKKPGISGNLNSQQ